MSRCRIGKIFPAVAFLLFSRCILLGVEVILAPKTIFVPLDPSQAGPSVNLFSKSELWSYECPSDKCKKVGRYVRGTEWRFPFTPAGEWHKVYNEYLKSSDLIKVKPSDCKLLTYKIGKVEGSFFVEGFNRDELLKLTQYAEQQWEIAANKNLFEQDGNGIYVIDFFMDDFHFTRSYAEEWAGVFVAQKKAIHILGRLFSVFSPVRNHPQKKEIYTALIARTIMHELGHALGLDHLDDSNAIMYFRNKYSFEMPELSPADIEYVKNVCGD